MSFMASQQNEHDHILRPRAIKPGNPMVLRAQSEDRGLKPNGAAEIPSTGVSRYIHVKGDENRS